MSLKFTNNATMLAYLSPMGYGATFFALQPTAAQIAAFQALYPANDFRQVVDGNGVVLVFHFSGTTLFNSLDPQGNQAWGSQPVLRESSELAPYVNNVYNRPRLAAGGSLWYNPGIAAINTPALAITKAAYMAAFGSFLTA